jgi:hypothetical protein
VTSGTPIRDLVLRRGLLDARQLDEILSADAMTRGGITGSGAAGGPGTGRSETSGEAGRRGAAIRKGDET